MKLRFKKLTIFIVSLPAIIAVFFIIMQIRSPVIIVTDQSFILIYGESRIRTETWGSSLALFRPVRTVVIADDAGDDVVPFTVGKVSSRPYCVIFPLRFSRSARLYREGNPDIPVVLLQGRGDDNSAALIAAGININDYYIYKTDIENDFYKAGLAASTLDMGKNGKITVILERHLQTQAVNSFLRAINSQGNSLETVFYNSYSQFSEIPGLSCVVLAGEGVEYLEKSLGVPVIFFTWIDPLLMPFDVALVINDSPYVQVIPAVRMVSAGHAQGQIKSKFLPLKSKNIDIKSLLKILKSG